MSMNECIKVGIRVRPPLNTEIAQEEIVFCSEDSKGIQVTTATNLITSQFDRVFSTQELNIDVFDWSSEIMKQPVQGINATVFAYGQTGSGKTHTMFGAEWDTNTTKPPIQLSRHTLDDPSTHGIIPRAINEVFQEIQMKGENFTVLISFMQIYNERIYDVLQDEDSIKPLNIRQDNVFGIYVEGISEYVVQNVRDCMALIKRGDRNRAVRSTRMNRNSSRSHTIFQLILESDKANKKGCLTKAKLNLCDLAGSEKYDKQGSIMGSAHLRELKTINLSLTTLGKVIGGLAKAPQKKFQPYRDSKLTRLLQDSLGGNTKTCFIATVAPIRSCMDETISTLKFADRAKQIMQNVKKNEVSATNDKLVRKLLREVDHLREILNLKKAGGPLKEVNEKLWILKEENEKLKEMAAGLTVDQVEKLKQENKSMKVQLQRFYLASQQGFTVANPSELPETNSPRTVDNVLPRMDSDNFCRYCGNRHPCGQDHSSEPLQHGTLTPLLAQNQAGRNSPGLMNSMYPSAANTNGASTPVLPQYQTGTNSPGLIQSRYPSVPNTHGTSTPSLHQNQEGEDSPALIHSRYPSVANFSSTLASEKFIADDAHSTVSQSQKSLGSQSHSTLSNYTNLSRLRRAGNEILLSTQDLNLKSSSDVEVRIRGKYNSYAMKKGNIFMSLDEQTKKTEKQNMLRQAQNRLRKLEQIEIYRTKKVQQQIKDIEEQKIQEDDRFRKAEQDNRRRQEYMTKSKVRLQQYEVAKKRRQDAENERCKKQAKLEKQAFEHRRLQLQRQKKAAVKKREKEIMQSLEHFSEPKVQLN